MKMEFSTTQSDPANPAPILIGVSPKRDPTEKDKISFSEKIMVNPSGDSDSENSEHRDDTFVMDRTRSDKVQDMVRTAWSKDNSKQISKLLSNKDRKLSSVAVDKMRILWGSMLEFKVMFNDRPAHLQTELHYIEALIEVLRLAAEQTGGWKLVLGESVNPFTGTLAIEPLAIWGIQKREIQMFHRRADKLASQLRKKFEEANPPAKGDLSEDESGPEPGPSNPENDPSDNHRDDKDEENQGEFSDLSDESFYSRLNGPSCNVLEKGPVDRKEPTSKGPFTLTPTSNGPSILIPDPEPPHLIRGNIPIQSTSVHPPLTLSPPSLTEINPSTSSPIHRDEKQAGTQTVDGNQLYLGPRRKSKQNGAGLVSPNRLARDKDGCSRYLQNSLLSTRSHETATAQHWGRHGQNRTRETRGQVKRGSSINYPVPKRSRSVQVEKLRAMNQQFAQCLNLYQQMEQGMQGMQMQGMHMYQGVTVDNIPESIMKPKCAHCTRLAGFSVRHFGPFGGRGKNCLFNQDGQPKHNVIQ